MRVDTRSASVEELDRLERALHEAVDHVIPEITGRKKQEMLTAEVRIIGNRPAADLPGESQLLKTIRAVDAHLGNTARIQRASTDANIPLSLGREAIAIGAGGSGGGAHTIHEWYDSAGRDLGLKRILLLDLGACRSRRRMKPLLLALASLMLLNANSFGSSASASSKDAPDIIFVNGDIYTQAAPARAQAMAIRDGRIIAVGSNEDIRKMKQSHTEVVDLGGHFVMPGFNDAHLHLAAGGRMHLQVDLVGVKSLAEMQQRIAEHAKTMPPGDWIVGRGWDHTLWVGETLPTRQDIDTVTGDHPAILFVRVDGHIGVANTAALKAAGILSKTPDPPGGKIDRDASGVATGMLRETAKDRMLAKVPRPSLAQRRKRHRAGAGRRCPLRASRPMQDNSEWEDFLVYEDLEKEGKLTVAHQRVADVQRASAVAAAASRATSGRTIPCCIPRCSKASWMARWARARLR